MKLTKYIAKIKQLENGYSFYFVHVNNSIRNLNPSDFKCSVSNHYTKRNIILWCYTTNIVSYYLLKELWEYGWQKSHLFRKANTILYFYIYKL